MAVGTTVIFRDGNQVEDRARGVRHVVDEHLNLLLHDGLKQMVVDKVESVRRYRIDLDGVTSDGLIKQRSTVQYPLSRSLLGMKRDKIGLENSILHIGYLSLALSVRRNRSPQHHLLESNLCLIQSNTHVRIGLAPEG